MRHRRENAISAMCARAAEPDIRDRQGRHMGACLNTLAHPRHDALVDRQVVVHGQRDVRVKYMPEPARPLVDDTFDAGNMLGGVPDLVDQTGLDTIEHASPHGARGLPDDAEDRNGDDQPDARIRERLSEPHAERANTATVFIFKSSPRAFGSSHAADKAGRPAFPPSGPLRPPVSLAAIPRAERQPSTRVTMLDCRKRCRSRRPANRRSGGKASDRCRSQFLSP